MKWSIINQNTGSDWIDDLYVYLLMYRSTQHSTTLKTPTEMMFGRIIRNKPPCIFKPLDIDEESADRDKEEKNVNYVLVRDEENLEVELKLERSYTFEQKPLD